MTEHVLRMLIDVPFGGARMFRRQLGIDAFRAIRCQGVSKILVRGVILAASSRCTQVRSAFDPWRCGTHAYRLTSRRATVRPNKSFKPMPLRGTA